MPKFRTVVEYDGTAYHGWQLQKELCTIQGEMERALARIVGKPTRVHGAGRTDAGVHATGQVAHFVSDWSRGIDELKRGCNALLPADIALVGLDYAADDFHARHSAHCKTYVYRILNRPIRSPLQRLYAWHIPQTPDVDRMAEAARHLIGTHDFAAFGTPTDGTPSTVREILNADWRQNSADGTLNFSITGTGFLRYMVRALVGTLVLVGRNKLKPEQFLAVLRSRDRSKSGPTAPPHGLCLESVEYGDSEDRPTRSEGDRQRAWEPPLSLRSKTKSSMAGIQLHIGTRALGAHPEGRNQAELSVIPTEAGIQSTMAGSSGQRSDSLQPDSTGPRLSPG